MIKRRVYLDTSAYLASLLNESRAGVVRKAVDKAAVFTSVLLVAETKRALVRLSRDGKVSMQSYVTLSRQVDADCATFALAPVSHELCASQVMPTVATPRTLDLIHLRTALWFHEQHLLTAFFAVRAHGAKRLSLDGDIMVTHSTHGELRDQFTLFKNPRLGKEQFSTSFGAEIDVYVEDQHKLRIPFDEIQAYVEKRNGLWVACGSEHLLILKLDALRDRRHSDKGANDIEDIFVLVSQAQFKHQPVLNTA